MVQRGPGLFSAGLARARRPGMAQAGCKRGSLRGAAVLGAVSVDLAGRPTLSPTARPVVLATGHRIDLARLGRVLLNRPAVSAFGQPGHRADKAE